MKLFNRKTIQKIFIAIGLKRNPLAVKTLTFIICVILFAALLCLMSCRTQKVVSEKKTAQAVEVITVNLGTVNRSVILYGTVYGSSQVTIYPKITGRVTQIVKPEGSIVNEGDTIIYVLNDLPGMDYKPGPVRSPIAGIVGKIYVDIGQTVGPTVPVATVANYAQNVRVKAPISDQDLKYVKKGTMSKISVSTIENETFIGTVTYISSIIDPLTGSATVEITIPNQEKRLIPGMACKVELLLEQKVNVIALPLSAFFSDNYTKVMVVDKDSICRFREIKIGLIGDELVEIKSGLEIGEMVITTGKERLADGDKVIPIAY